ncbi:MAG: tetratricopeptide repeat protein [Thermodesulfobacteriota bacterium]
MQQPACTVRETIEPTPATDPHDKISHLRELAAGGRLEEACRLGRDLYRSDPANTRLLRLLGRLYYLLGDPASATHHFAELLGLDAANAVDHYNLGMALQQQGNLSQALVALDNAVVLRNDFPEAHLARGNLLMAIDRPAEAVAAYLAAGRVPRFAHSAQYNLAMAYAKLQLWPAAVQALRQAAAANPADVTVLVQLSSLLQDQHRGEEALEVLQTALRHMPDQAILHERLGDIHLRNNTLDEAIRAYRQVVRLSPPNTRASNNLGLALQRYGKPEEAIAVLRQAAAVDGRVAQTWFNLGNALMETGDRAEAAKAYGEAVRLRPEHGEAWFNLGLSLQKLRRFCEAESAYRRALTLDGQHELTLFNLGVVQHAMGRPGDAVGSYRHCLQLAPAHALALYNLGIALHEEGCLPEAVESFRKALALRPADVRILNNLGLACTDLGDYPEAEAVFRQALAIQPDLAEVHSNLGNVYQKTGREEEALQAYADALAHDPGFAKALYNQGCILLGRNQVREAEAKYRKAIELDPELVEAHWNMSHALLLQGKMEEGFREYRWRWRRRDADVIVLPIPEWRGESRPEATLLVLSEQGKGDTLQFVRYLSSVRKRVGRILLVCDGSLRALLARMAAVDEVLGTTEVEGACRRADCHVPLLNLPELMGTTLAAIPATVPYLPADPARIEEFRQLFAPCRDRLKVGLVWRGNPDHRNDHNRSCPADTLAPLTALDGIALFSLQKNEPVDTALTGLTDLAPLMDSFAATAALMAHLDLVISVDTAVAHLAGALGRPVWTLLPFAPDWRWMLERDDTPWYPTMRLFRQPAAGSWHEVIAAVTADLLSLRDSRRFEKE